MTNALVVIGDSLHHHKVFIDYLQREVESQIGLLDTIHFLRKKDNNIVLALEEVIKEHRHVVIATDEEFSFTSKVIATICEDSIMLKGDMLVPFKAEHCTKDSYLVKKEQTSINVLHVSSSQNIPRILIQTEQKKLSFYLFDITQQSYIEKHLVSLGIVFDKMTVIDNLIQYHIYAKWHKQIQSFLEVLDTQLEHTILVGEDLAEIISTRLIEGKLNITCAESCTGGLLASEIVKNSGVSDIFAGSIVTYSNDMKRKLLGVRESTLERYGAVSHECVTEMLTGVMHKFYADFSMAISGVAGPTGGTPEKPVGTVYVGAKSRKNGIKIEKLTLDGDRTYIREQSVLWALKLLVESDKNFFFKKNEKTLDK